jgi:hypothetical protein
MPYITAIREYTSSTPQQVTNNKLPKNQGDELKLTSDIASVQHRKQTSAEHCRKNCKLYGRVHLGRYGLQNSYKPPRMKHSHCGNRGCKMHKVLQMSWPQPEGST